MLHPEPFMVIPFLVLLGMIASGPVLYARFWEKHYAKFSILLAAIVAGYYAFFLRDISSVVHSSIEYISFIALLSSLFITAGGILIKFDHKGSPVMNALFLLFGAVISNIIGTTGASMLLIRPYIKMNKDSIRPYHIIFFIFVVSNVGGALTPIGDPPLFLGFLRGIPFFWVISNIWYIWLLTVFVILLVFFVIELRCSKVPVKELDFVEFFRSLEIHGKRNFGFLLIIICSVFLDHSVMSWVPDLRPFPLGLREMIMFCVSYAAYKTAKKKVLHANGFDFEPIKEVAFLFVGIFITMIPALQLIAYESKQYGNSFNTSTFYWASGILSSFLDNAPTYLNFLSGAMGKFGLDVNILAHVKEFMLRDAGYLQAISVGSVFFGAMTYIGNGPNFMVKSISERAGIKMPSFLSYILVYSIPVLLPIFIVVWLVFFK
jgi:Na+/H+ antiporter NhaD/arsenite permease-like protein